MHISFTHNQSAHCESGVTANLFSHNGLPLSEAMAFGIGGGLFFGYFPFIKANYLPLTTYRKRPGGIIKNCADRLGVKIHRQRFRSPQKAMDALDHAISEGFPVGLQTGVYWLPYFPPALRFHFNAHNLVVYGKEGNDYLISDPVIEKPVVCTHAELMRARFAKGSLAPKGHMYYLLTQSNQSNMTLAALLGIREVSRTMLTPFVGLIGVRGIRKLSRHIVQWPTKLGDGKALRYLGHVIRMQEEIGTGGGGFRFIFSAFLQETADLTGEHRFREISNEMTRIGDRWREFALFSARICKQREKSIHAFSKISSILNECADREEMIFRELKHLAASILKQKKIEIRENE